MAGPVLGSGCRPVIKIYKIMLQEKISEQSWAPDRAQKWREPSGSDSIRNTSGQAYCK